MRNESKKGGYPSGSETVTPPMTPTGPAPGAQTRSSFPRDVLKLRLHPSCGHKKLMDCPLNTRDWEEVHRAYKAFRAVCLSVAEAAEERTKEMGDSG